jgi:hypothetical protein
MMTLKLVYLKKFKNKVLTQLMTKSLLSGSSKIQPHD